MFVSVNYDDVITNCEMLSQYEGRDYYGEDGGSLYLQVKITGQDHDLMRTYISDGAMKVADMISRLITYSEYKSNGFQWTLRTEETRFKYFKMGDKLINILSSYAMGKWLDGRKSDRKEAYEAMFAEECECLRKTLLYKSPPVHGKKAGYNYETIISTKK